MTDPAPAPLFLDQTEVRRAEKIFFRDRAPPALLPVSHGLDDRPPPPPRAIPYLKDWITTDLDFT